MFQGHCGSSMLCLGGGGRFELGTNQKEEGWVINNLEREGRWGRDGHFTLHVLMNKLEG